MFMSIQDDGNVFVTLQEQAVEFQGNSEKVSGRPLNFALCCTSVSITTGFDIAIWGLIYNLPSRWSNFEGMLIFKYLLLAYGSYMVLKLHLDCCCPLHLYDKTHLNISSYCFHYFAFTLRVLTSASCIINFHVLEFRLHCEIQTILFETLSDTSFPA